MKLVTRALLSTLFLIAGTPVSAFAVGDPVDEYLDPTCAPRESEAVTRYTTFVNGLDMFNWEIRLLKKGNHFNYEICFDPESRTNLAALPQKFTDADGDDHCQLASTHWIHIKFHEKFKQRLISTLKADIEKAQKRQNITAAYAMLEPMLKAADYLTDHIVTLILPTTIVGAWALGRLSTSAEATMVGRLGNYMLRTSKTTAIVALVLIGLDYWAKSGSEPGVVVKDNKGRVVTETTVTAQEFQDIIRVIKEKTGLTDEQLPKAVRNVFEQLKDAIPNAMEETFSFDVGCQPAA